jgi:hypothetical protein
MTAKDDANEAAYQKIFDMVKENKAAIDVLAVAVRKTHGEMAATRQQVDSLREDTAPSREFFDDVAAIARFGRTFRNIVAWMAIVSGGFAAAWAYVSGNSNQGG